VEGDTSKELYCISEQNNTNAQVHHGANIIYTNHNAEQFALSVVLTFVCSVSGSLVLTKMFGFGSDLSLDKGSDSLK
jgi:hypothetical protein